MVGVVEGWKRDISITVVASCFVHVIFAFHVCCEVQYVVLPQMQRK